MLPIEIYELYKARIECIQRQFHKLSRIEATTDVNGLLSVDSLEKMVKLAVERVKTEIAFLKEPFEPATLDNYETQLFDTGSQMQVFEQTPSTHKFDSRDIFDHTKMLEMTAEIFRAATAVQFSLPKKIPIPEPLIKVDKCLNAILVGLYRKITNVAETSPLATLTGHEYDEEHPIISFEILDTQKYFTKEEREAIAKREEEKQKAIREAERVTKLQNEASVIQRELFESFKELTDNVRSLHQEALAYGGPALKKCFALIASASNTPVAKPLTWGIQNCGTIKGMQFVASDKPELSLTVRDLAYANRLLKGLSIFGFMNGIVNHESYFKTDFRIYGEDENDFNDNTVIPNDTIIDYFVES